MYKTPLHLKLITTCRSWQKTSLLAISLFGSPHLVISDLQRLKRASGNSESELSINKERHDVVNTWGRIYKKETSGLADDFLKNA